MSTRLVILNDFERPEAACIALIRGDMWTYVSVRKRESGYAGWTNIARAQDHTPLDVFGVAARVVNAPNFDRLVIQRVAPSRAVYSDGEPRDWQAELPDGTGIKPELIEFVREAIGTATDREAQSK